MFSASYLFDPKWAIGVLVLTSRRLCYLARRLTASCRVASKLLNKITKAMQFGPNNRAESN
jgi:hypothetical protein